MNCPPVPLFVATLLAAEKGLLTVLLFLATVPMGCDPVKG